MGCLNEEGWVVFRAVGPFLQTVCGNLWAAQTRHTPFYTHIYYKPSATRLLLHGRLRRWGWIHGGMDWKKKMEEYIKIYKCINTYFPNTKISKHKTMLLSWSEYVEPEVLQLEVDSSYTYTIVCTVFTFLLKLLKKDLALESALYFIICLTDRKFKGLMTHWCRGV